MENINNFFKNYSTALKIVNERFSTCNESEKEMYKLYKKSLEDLINTMIEYTKSVFVSVSFGTVDNYNSDQEYKEYLKQINQTRIIFHNNLISNVKVVDLICKRLGCEPVFGNLGKYENNVDSLFQSDPLNRDSMPAEALEKRLEIFNWACQIVIETLTKSKSLSENYMKDPEAFKEMADFFEYMEDNEITEKFDNKIGR